MVDTVAHALSAYEPPTLTHEQLAIQAWRKAKAEAERTRLILVARSDELERARDTHQQAHYACEQAYSAMLQAITEGV